MGRGGALDPDPVAAPPTFSAAVAPYRVDPFIPNGQWIFIDENNKHSWNRQSNNFMPGVGFA